VSDRGEHYTVFGVSAPYQGFGLANIWFIAPGWPNRSRFTVVRARYAAPHDRDRQAAAAAGSPPSAMDTLPLSSGPSGESKDRSLKKGETWTL